MRRVGKAGIVTAAILCGATAAPAVAAPVVVPAVVAPAVAAPVVVPAVAAPAVAAPVVVPAVAAPAVAARAVAAPARAQPVTVCTVSDRRLDELSGLAGAGAGYVTVNDGSDDASHRRIFYLTSRCALSRSVSYPSRPRDTEDLAVAPDGTLWVADIGDNGRSRKTVGLWKLAPGAAKPVLHRFTYPDGPHDAETLVLNGDGTPIIITKDPFTAGLYVPAAKLKAGATIALRRAGSFAIPQTSTSNPYGLPGRLVLTGGATSPDGTKVALRTYADAFEFPVTGGDVIAAVTTGTAVTTALPDEPQGESVAYSADGTALLTVSETAGAPAGTKPRILRYPSALHTAARSSAAPAASSARPGSPAAAAGEPAPEPDPTKITKAGAAGAAVILLALLALGLARRRRRT